MAKLYDRIWVNGCFDILHVGHIRMLRYAKSIANEVIVGVDSDTKVKNDKGDGRPINNANDRMEVLHSLESVDHVVMFNSNIELKHLIKTFYVDAVLDGEEYRDRVVIPDSFLGDIIYYPRYGEYSTTSIIETYN